MKDTCEWVTKSEIYRSWLQDNHSTLLWLSGPPSTGKTTISVFLTDVLAAKIKANVLPENEETGLLAFYFFNGQDERKGTAVTLLRGLIHMILLKKPALVSHMVEDFRYRKNDFR